MMRWWTEQGFRRETRVICATDGVRTYRHAVDMVKVIASPDPFRIIGYEIGWVASAFEVRT